jgi:hypothetical protein
VSSECGTMSSTSVKHETDNTSTNNTASSSSTSPSVNVPSSSGAKGPLPPPPPPPLKLCIVLKALHYLSPFAKLIILAQPLDNASGEAELDAFLALQLILATAESGKQESINIFPFLDKFCRYIGLGFSDFDEMDVFLVWDYVVKLITLVVPPLREVFMGRHALPPEEQAWHALTTRCVHAQFSQTVQSLEEFISLSQSQFEKDYYNDLELYSHKTSLESVKNFNSIVLGRGPDIIVFAVESTHLHHSLRFLDALSKNPSRIKPPSTIAFPATFSLSTKERDADDKEHHSVAAYDLATVVSVEGIQGETVNSFFRASLSEPNGAAEDNEPIGTQQWVKGAGAAPHETADLSTAVTAKNYFHANDTKRVHPRLLIYTKRNYAQSLWKLQDCVSKAGQLRCKGDSCFESAETPEHYDEAKAFYEEAIAHDEVCPATLLNNHLGLLLCAVFVLCMFL